MTVEWSLENLALVLPIVFDEKVRLRPLKREYGWPIRCEIRPPPQVGRGAHEPANVVANAHSRSVAKQKNEPFLLSRTIECGG